MQTVSSRHHTLRPGEGVRNLNEPWQEPEVGSDLIETRFRAISVRDVPVRVATNEAGGWQGFQSRHDADGIRAKSHVIAEAPILVNATLVPDIFKDSIQRKGVTVNVGDERDTGHGSDQERFRQLV
jgi:hypothetical protein